MSILLTRKSQSNTQQVRSQHGHAKTECQLTITTVVACRCYRYPLRNIDFTYPKTLRGFMIDILGYLIRENKELSTKTYVGKATSCCYMY